MYKKKIKRKLNNILFLQNNYQKVKYYCNILIFYTSNTVIFFRQHPYFPLYNYYSLL